MNLNQINEYYGRKKIKDALAQIDKDYIAHFVSFPYGKRIAIMKKDGTALVEGYWNSTSENKIVLCNLSVDSDFQRKGTGEKMIDIVEKFGKEIGITSSILWVDPSSWMHKWFIRKGYKDYAVAADGFVGVWMIKELTHIN